VSLESKVFAVGDFGLLKPPVSWRFGRTTFACCCKGNWASWRKCHCRPYVGVCFVALGSGVGLKTNPPSSWPYAVRKSAIGGCKSLRSSEVCCHHSTAMQLPGPEFKQPKL